MKARDWLLPILFALSLAGMALVIGARPTPTKVTMKKTLDQILAAHPEMRVQLTELARRFTPAGFDDDGNMLYSEQGLLLAAGVESGGVARAGQTKGAVAGIEYR